MAFDLDRLERLLEDMEPAEIDARYGAELGPEGRAMLRHFSSLDDDLAAIRAQADPPDVSPLPKNRPWFRVMPMAAIFLVGFFGLYLFVTGEDPMPHAEPEAMSAMVAEDEFAQPTAGFSLMDGEDGLAEDIGYEEQAVEPALGLVQEGERDRQESSAQSSRLSVEEELQAVEAEEVAERVESKPAPAETKSIARARPTPKRDAQPSASVSSLEEADSADLALQTSQPRAKRERVERPTVSPSGTSRKMSKSAPAPVVVPPREELLEAKGAAAKVTESDSRRDEITSSKAATEDGKEASNLLNEAAELEDESRAGLNETQELRTLEAASAAPADLPSSPPGKPPLSESQPIVADEQEKLSRALSATPEPRGRGRTEGVDSAEKSGTRYQNLIPIKAKGPVASWVIRFQEFLGRPSQATAKDLFAGEARLQWSLVNTDALATDSWLQVFLDKTSQADTKWLAGGVRVEMISYELAADGTSTVGLARWWRVAEPHISADRANTGTDSGYLRVILNSKGECLQMDDR